MGLIEQATPEQREFFTNINAELADKGFLVTSTEELFQWARTGSLWWMTFGLACFCLFCCFRNRFLQLAFANQNTCIGLHSCFFRQSW